MKLSKLLWNQSCRLEKKTQTFDPAKTQQVALVHPFWYPLALNSFGFNRKRLFSTDLNGVLIWMRPSCQRPKTRSKRSWRVGWTTYVPAARIGYGVHDDGGLGPRLEPHLVFHLDQLVPAQCANKWEYVHILVLLTCQRSQSELEHRPCSFRFPPMPTSIRLHYQKLQSTKCGPNMDED